jgi:hypothetical protein
LLILLIGGKPDAGVVALDKDSGNVVWKTLTEYAAHSSPIVITVGGTRQLIVWTVKSVTALDPATGQPHWREKFNSGGSASVVSTPVFSDNRLLVNGLMLKLDAEKPQAAVPLARISEAQASGQHVNPSAAWQLRVLLRKLGSACLPRREHRERSLDDRQSH